MATLSSLPTRELLSTMAPIMPITLLFSVVLVLPVTVALCVNNETKIKKEKSRGNLSILFLCTEWHTNTALALPFIYAYVRENAINFHILSTLRFLQLFLGQHVSSVFQILSV